MCSARKCKTVCCSNIWTSWQRSEKTGHSTSPRKSVKVTDGRLVVQFLYEVEFPCVAGIAIKGTTDDTNQFAGQPFERKINCGGPAYDDYEADLPTIAGSGRLAVSAGG